LVVVDLIEVERLRIKEVEGHSQILETVFVSWFLVPGDCTRNVNRLQTVEGHNLLHPDTRSRF
jgi:hypothetical protein